MCPHISWCQQKCLGQLVLLTGIVIFPKALGKGGGGGGVVVSTTCRVVTLDTGPILHIVFLYLGN